MKLLSKTREEKTNKLINAGKILPKKQNHQNQFQTSTSESIKAKSTELFKIPHQLVNKLSPAIKYNKIFLAEVI